MVSNRRPGKLKAVAGHKVAQTQSMSFFAHRPARSAPYSHAMDNFDVAVPEPFFATSSADQSQFVGQVRVLFTLLNYYVRCFEAAVQLYEFSAIQINLARTMLDQEPTHAEADETLEVFDGWPIVACRDGAMSVYHFERTLSGLNDTMRSCQDLDTEDRRKAKKQARKDLANAFPNILGARNATAHSGDKARTAEDADAHGFTGDWSNTQFTFVQNSILHNIVLIDCLNNRQYSNTWQKAVISYRIGIEGVRDLAKVRDLIYSAYADGGMVSAADVKDQHDTDNEQWPVAISDEC